MTGFGTSSLRSARVDIEVSLKAVNNRYLEVRYHMPREYTAFEADIKKIISEKIKRGTVDLYVRRRLKATEASLKIKTNQPEAKVWLKAAQKLARDLKLEPSKVSITDVIRHVNPLSFEDNSTASAAEKKSLYDQIKKSLTALEKERVREGGALKKDLQVQLKQLSKFTTQVHKMREKVNKGLKARLEERIAKWGLEDKFNPDRLAQEVVLLVDKSDITEEITRLKEHIRNFTKLMGEAGPRGKKLDFYCQELLREVNTVGSKTQVAQMTGEVVEAKTRVERIREQVQNIE